MLKQGLFIDETGTTYTVYEQIVGTFRRIDICKEGASFHTGVADVLFSAVYQKDTAMFGDRRLFARYNDLLDSARQVRATSTASHEWKLGRYYTKIVRAQPSSQFLEETVQCDGKLDSYTVQLGPASISMWVLAEYSDSKLIPLNIVQYETVALSTVDTTTTAAPYYSLAVLKARYDIAHIEECDFVVADTLEVATQRLERWKSAPALMKGIDTETTGTDFTILGEDKLVGVILSYSPTEATYFPFGHKMFDNLSEDFLHKELMPAVLAQERILVSHNKKFERKVFLSIGWNIHIKYDTMPLSFMVNPVIERGAHALKELMFEVTGKKFLELEDIFVSSKLIDFSILPKDIVRVYACPDAASLLTLYPYLWEKLPEYSRNITMVEFDLADVKADQEYYGMRVDVEKFLRNLDNCDYVLDKLLKAFRMLTGIDGNINSTDVLSDLIYGKMNCPVLVRTKTGKPSTGAASVKKLASIKVDKERTAKVEGDITDKFGKVIVSGAALNKAKYPALVVLEKYRLYSKLRTAFYSRFEKTAKGGRIFFWVNQNGAASGRQSSPMHQLPGELKDIILSDTPEHDMWDPDYSQIELRMIAFLSGEKELIELCKDPENDIHRAIGSLISRKEMWQISSEERKVGKRRNFGVVYMISAHGLAAQIAGAGYSAKDVEEAGKSLDEFYHSFKRISKYVATNAEKVKNQGYLTTFFGRNRYFREIFDPEISSKKRNSLIRQANNLPVQGTAADYLKIAETNLDAYIRNKGWDQPMENGFPRVRVALSIHDEVLLMADRSIPYEEIILMIRTCMEMPIEGAPPFFSSPALVETWKQHDDDSVAMPVLLRDKLIKDYQETGVSKLNRENYMEVLNTYRDNVLHDYMRGLIKEYGTDPAVVSEHVRHPSLTHELIARYPPPKGSDMDHVQSIAYATEQYIQGEDMSFTKETTKESVDTLADLADLQVLVNFDDNGNVVFETETDSIEEEVQDPYDDEKFVESLTSGQRMYVWELMDTICVDLEGLSDESCNKIIAEVYKSAVPDGFYVVMFVRNGLMLNGGFRVEDIDTIGLTEFVKEVFANDTSPGR